MSTMIPQERPSSRASARDRRLPGALPPLARGPRRLLAGRGEGAHLVSPTDEAGRWDYDEVDVAWFQDGSSTRPGTASTATPTPTRFDRHHLGRGRARPLPPHQLPDAQREVCRLANVLIAHGVRQGDRVCIYLPMIPSWSTRCSPARASARSTRWCSPASRPSLRQHPRRALHAADHGQRGPAAALHSAQGDRRRGDRGASTS